MLFSISIMQTLWEDFVSHMIWKYCHCLRPFYLASNSRSTLRHLLGRQLILIHKVHISCLEDNRPDLRKIVLVVEDVLLVLLEGEAQLLDLLLQLKNLLKQINSEVSQATKRQNRILRKLN